MELRPLTEENMEQVRIWRLGCPESLRTPYMLTEEMQQDYYRNTICNRQSTTRYWGLWTAGSVARGRRSGDFKWCTEDGESLQGWRFTGYGGIENISQENGNGEMSLLLGPEYRRKGHGKVAVGLFLDQAFNHLRLEHVYGECYECAPWKFWQEMQRVYGGPEPTWLPNRKYYQGEYHDSYYFTFTVSGYRSHTSKDREPGDSAKEHQDVLREIDGGLLDICGTRIEAV